MLVCDIGYLAWAGGILLVLHFLNLVGCLEGISVFYFKDMLSCLLPACFH